MKYSGKPEFVEATRSSWRSLLRVCRELDPAEMVRRSNCTGSGVDAIQWSPRDVCGHVHAWHRLLMQWYQKGLTGTPDLPAKGFNWRETPALNRKLYMEFREVETVSVMRRMKRSHGRIMHLVGSLDEGQLMKPGHFEWTRKLGLISYVSANTDSHYRWAAKKIKRLQK